MPRGDCYIADRCRPAAALVRAHYPDRRNLAVVSRYEEAVGDLPATYISLISAVCLAICFSWTVDVTVQSVT